MSICYIKEYDEQNTILKKFKKIFNVIEIENIDEKIFYKLPIDRKTKDKKIRKISEKLNADLYRTCMENVVLSEHLEIIENLKNKLYHENINILDGRKLFQFLILDVVKYIYSNQNKQIEEGQISILVNDNTELNVETIIDIAKEVKRINIVTNNIKKFKIVEEYLYNEFGIMIRVSNNQKKDLLNSEIIINIDFPKENFKKYTISNKCILINLFEEFNIEIKKFQGINISYYKINMPQDYKINGFRDELIYESFLYNKPIEKVKRQIEMDNVNIKDLIGKNGIINKKEFMALIT